MASSNSSCEVDDELALRLLRRSQRLDAAADR